MPADAFEVMVSRISGIVGGTLISLLLAVTVYPSSANDMMIRHCNSQGDAAEVWSRRCGIFCFAWNIMALMVLCACRCV